MNEDQIALLRETASAATRNLGFATDPQRLPPELWQRVLAAVETRARMGGADLPDGWREQEQASSHGQEYECGAVQGRIISGNVKEHDGGVQIWQSWSPSE